MRSSPIRNGRARSASAPASTCTTTRCSPRIIAKHGEAKTEEWLKGLKANLAQKPSGGDREVARDIAAGKCDIGLGNTYYWALMNDKEADRKPWADATKVILPTFAGRRHACEPVGRGAGEACAEQGQRHEADRVAGRRARAASVCGHELRISAAERGQGQSDDRRLRHAQARRAAARRGREATRRRAANLVDKVGFDN